MTKGRTRERLSMMSWLRNRGALLLAVLGVAVVTAPVLAQKKEEKKLSNNERAEVQKMVARVDAAMKSAEPPASDYTLTWHNDFLKALEGKTYVPFTIS